MTAPTPPPFAPPIKQPDFDNIFLSGPSEYLVQMTRLQMAAVSVGTGPSVRYPFQQLFGPYTPPTGAVTDENQRWADYERFDWSIRQLPAINIFESETPEQKDSDQAFLKGNIKFQVIWTPNLRRPDARRLEVAFKGAMQNFFSSKYVTQMLDELYYIQRPMKVYGLNEFGKTMTWTPNVQGIIQSEVVPVTIIEANYRIDLRAWYRALEYMNRTKDDPFELTLANLSQIGDGVKDGYAGLDDNGTKEVFIPDQIDVTNP